MRNLFTEEFLEALDRWNGDPGIPAPENKKRVALRVFKSAFIENWLATAHPIVPGIWSIPLVIGLIAWGHGLGLSPIGQAIGFVLGVLFWTALEYVLHRWVFHRIPSPLFVDRLMQFMAHGYHHEFPEDPGRLVAPPLMAWPIAGVVGGFWWLVAGTWGLPLFAGTIAGYLAYDWVHYYTHHARPKTRLGKLLRRLHAIHHYSEPQLNMGISNPLWDLVLGTYTYSRTRSEGSARRL